MTFAIVKRLPGSGGAQERLVTQAAGQPVGELLDRLGLVPGGLEGGDELELRHAETIAGAAYSEHPF